MIFYFQCFFKGKKFLGLIFNIFLNCYITLIFLKKYLQLKKLSLEWIKVFHDSSAVEQLTVNQLVAGSIPARGARSFFNYRNHWLLIILDNVELR